MATLNICNFKNLTILYCQINDILFELFDPLQFYARNYLEPPIFLFGLFGNLVSIIIFLKRKDIPGTSRIFYLAIAYSDLVYIITIYLANWTGDNLAKFTNGLILFWPTRIHNFSCRTIRYAWHSSIFLSNWTLAIFSIERLIAITYPFRSRLFTIKTRIKTCSALFIIGLILFSPVLFTDLYRVKNPHLPLQSRMCDLNINDVSFYLALWFVFMTTFQTGILSPTVVIIANAKLWFKLKDVFENRNVLVPGRVKLLSNSEIKSAKDLLILAIVLTILDLPMMTGIVYTILKGQFWALIWLSRNFAWTH